MLEFSLKFGRIPDHVWTGTSVENWAFKRRIDTLRAVPANIRFVSFEPLLDSTRPPLDLSGIQWAIAGVESGSDYGLLRLNGYVRFETNVIVKPSPSSSNNMAV